MFCKEVINVWLYSQFQPEVNAMKDVNKRYSCLKMRYLIVGVNN